MRRWIVAVLAVMTLAGCSSSGGAATDDPAGDGAPAATSYPTEPTNQLTGFGANIATWNENHRADPDITLAQDCCYGPKTRFFGQSSLQDTWYAVQVDPKTGEVYQFSHAFAPHTSDTAANAAMQQDLPPDATLVRGNTADGCRQFLYKSAALAKQSHLGAYVLVLYVSPPDESVYYPDNIWNATVEVGAADTDLTSC